MTRFETLRALALLLAVQVEVCVGAPQLRARSSDKSPLAAVAAASDSEEAAPSDLQLLVPLVVVDEDENSGGAKGHSAEAAEEGALAGALSSLLGALNKRGQPASAERDREPTYTLLNNDNNQWSSSAYEPLVRLLAGRPVSLGSSSGGHSLGAGGVLGAGAAGGDDSASGSAEGGAARLCLVDLGSRHDRDAMERVPWALTVESTV